MLEGSDEDYSLLYTNADVVSIVGTMPLRNFIQMHHLKFIAHICREPNNTLTKKMMFAVPLKPYYRDPWLKIAKSLGVSVEQAKSTTQSREGFSELLNRRFRPSSSTP